VESTKIELKLKDHFKSEKYYKLGYILVNERREKNRKGVNSLPEKLRVMPIEHTITPNAGSTIDLFGDSSVRVQQKKSEKMFVKEIPINVLLKGIRLFPSLSFNKLKQKFPNLNSIEDFIFGESYLSNMTIMLIFPYDYEYTNVDLLNSVTKLYNEVSTYISKIKVQYEGTIAFKEQPVSKYIKDIVTYREVKPGARHGEGVSQIVDDQYAFDLSNEDWYVYNDNYGTSEEKSFVKYFAGTVEEFKKKYSKVFLIRNEQQFGIYSFSSGERFEPDYILVLVNEIEGKETIYYQVFIEPKGSQFIGYDGTFSTGKESWKEHFLREIVDMGIEHKIFTNSERYKIWGLPFYNESITLNEFDYQLRNLLI
jgi:type III restriction enzyme